MGLLTHRLKNPKSRPPMVTFYSALSGDREGLERDRPQLQLPRSAIEACVAAQGLQPAGYYVLAPGAVVRAPLAGTGQE